MHNVTTRLARTCGKGKWKSNAQRDVLRFLYSFLAITIELLWVPIRIKSKDGQGRETIFHPMVPPHDYFEALSTQSDAVWNAVLGPAETATAYWRHQRGRPDFDSNCPEENEEGTCWPMFLFGDDAGVFNKPDEKYLVILCGSCLQRVSAWTGRLVLTILPTEWLLDDNTTLHDLNWAIQWSFRQGYLGINAEYNHLGQPLTKKMGKKRFARKGKLMAGGYTTHTKKKL